MSETLPTGSPKHLYVLALDKGAEHYVFIYDHASRSRLLRTLEMFASNPDLSFTWQEAAILSQKVRQQSLAILSEKKPNPPTDDKDIV